MIAAKACMSIEHDRADSGVAALLLSVSTLHALKKTGTLTDYELADIVKQSLERAELGSVGDRSRFPRLVVQTER